MVNDSEKIGNVDINLFDGDLSNYSKSIKSMTEISNNDINNMMVARPDIVITKSPRIRRWSSDEDTMLLEYYNIYGKQWKVIGWAQGDEPHLLMSWI
jgi:hypothetical protein